MPTTQTKTLDFKSTYNYQTVRRTWSVVTGWNINPPINRVSNIDYDPNRRYLNRNWNRTPGYKALLAAQGFLPTLEMNEKQRTMRYSSSANAVWRNKNPGIYEWYDEPLVFHSPTWPSQASLSGWKTTTARSNLEAQAEHKCLAKARDMKVNMPVMFGEGRRTVRLLTDSVNTLGRAYSAFRRGRFKDAARALGLKDPPKGVFSQHWLAYQYGWKPLLSDAQGLVDLARQQVDEYHRRTRFSVNAKAESLVKSSYTNSGGSLFATLLKTHKGEIYSKAKSGLLLEVSFRPSALLAQTGFGITDLTLLAWELIPFSFVFDWFIKVGQYLESASALQGLTVKCGYTSWAQTSRNLVYELSVTDANYRLESGLLPGGSIQEREFFRRSWMGSQPALVIRDVGDALSASHLTTSAALWQVLTMGDRKHGAYRP